MAEFEFKTTVDSYGTAGRRIGGDYSDEYASDPIVPEGDGWQMCGMAAADGLVMWSWTRPKPKS